MTGWVTLCTDARSGRSQLLVMPTNAHPMRTTALWLLTIAALLLAGGCNARTAKYPPLGEVTGKVTSRGQPMANIVVFFQPTAGGRASTGTTDASGRYLLHYTDAARGAIVGEHVVSLTESFMNNTDPNASLLSPHGLKKKFSFTVNPGRNTFGIEISGD